MSAFSQGEGCGEHGSSRVGLLARGPRRQGGKLGIVVVQHMTLNAVYQRGVLGAKFPRRAEYGGSATFHLTGKVSAQNLAGLFLDAAKHGRQTVEQVKLGLLGHRRGNIFWARPRDKFTDVFGSGFAGEGRETHVWRLTCGGVTCTSAFCCEMLKPKAAVNCYLFCLRTALRADLGALPSSIASLERPSILGWTLSRIHFSSHHSTGKMGAPCK